MIINIIVIAFWAASFMYYVYDTYKKSNKNLPKPIWVIEEKYTWTPKNETDIRSTYIIRGIFDDMKTAHKAMNEYANNYKNHGELSMRNFELNLLRR